ncbi:MAG: hypothetical protein R3C12_08255 [Planctomycetaceae bacterium]|nr:hypothetical protein [Planctomycetaceae bacterium]
MNSPPFTGLHDLQWEQLLSDRCLIDVPGQPAIYFFPDDEADALRIDMQGRVVLDSFFEAGRNCWLRCVNRGVRIESSRSARGR